jgi:SPP1 family phage portal protein
MVAFARGYKTIDDQGKEFEHFDIFLPDIEYYYIKTQEGWILDPELLSPKLKVSGVVNNEVGKIMIIYYSQKKPEWHKVQPMCERLETSVSNHGEINEYFGAPILTLRGRMIGQTDKGEVGKIIELDGPDAEAKFLALNSQPESIKMEEENLEKWIYTLSQTPNITFDAMKAIGDVSGVSLELMFMDAHMAAKNKEEIFGKGLQRRINLLKTAIGKVMDTSLSPLIDSLNFKPVITPYMPKNKAEMIEMLSVAVTSNIMSVDTSVDVNDLIMDKEAEKEKLADEKAQNDQADLSMQSELAKLKTGPLSKTPSKPLAK